MKKKLLAVTLVIALLATTGCGKKEEESVPTETSPAMTEESNPSSETEASEGETPATENTKADDMAATIMENVTMQDGMKKLETERSADNAYPGIADVSEEYAIYVNATGGFAEEIAVIKVKEGSSVDAVKNMLDTRVTFQRATFENYQPDEMVKLEHPVVMDNGEYVIMVIADDAKEATTAIETALS